MLKNMDDKMVKLLAFERLSQIRKQTKQQHADVNLPYDIDVSKLDGTEFLKEECRNSTDKQNKLINVPEPLCNVNSTGKEITITNSVGKEQYCNSRNVSSITKAMQQILVGKINAVISPLNALNKGVKFVAYKCITFGSGKLSPLDYKIIYYIIFKLRIADFIFIKIKIFHDQRD